MEPGHGAVSRLQKEGRHVATEDTATANLETEIGGTAAEDVVGAEVRAHRDRTDGYAVMQEEQEHGCLFSVIMGGRLGAGDPGKDPACGEPAGAVMTDGPNGHRVRAGSHHGPLRQESP